MRTSHVAILVLATSVSFFLIDCSSGSREHPTDQALRGAAPSKDELASLKDSLLQAGVYECCTQPGCDHCAVKYKRCPCYASIKKSDPICGECLEGYRSGSGKLKLVSIPELEQIRAAKGSP